MKIFRYFLRGVREIARELGVIKSVVKPRTVPPPRPGRTQDILRYLRSKHSLDGVALFDPNGTLIATTINKEEATSAFYLIQPILEETNGLYVFLRRKTDWLTLFRRRGFYLLLFSQYHPDIVDLWVIGREFERYMWGSVWED